MAARNSRPCARHPGVTSGAGVGEQSPPSQPPRSENHAAKSAKNMAEKLAAICCDVGPSSPPSAMAAGCGLALAAAGVLPLGLGGIRPPAAGRPVWSFRPAPLSVLPLPASRD